MMGVNARATPKPRTTMAAHTEACPAGGSGSHGSGPRSREPAPHSTRPVQMTGKRPILSLSNLRSFHTIRVSAWPYTCDMDASHVRHSEVDVYQRMQNCHMLQL